MDIYIYIIYIYIYTKWYCYTNNQLFGTCGFSFAWNATVEPSPVHNRPGSGCFSPDISTSSLRFCLKKPLDSWPMVVPNPSHPTQIPPPAAFGTTWIDTRSSWGHLRRRMSMDWRTRTHGTMWHSAGWSLDLTFVMFFVSIFMVGIPGLSPTFATASQTMFSGSDSVMFWVPFTQRLGDGNHDGL